MSEGRRNEGTSEKKGETHERKISMKIINVDDCECEKQVKFFSLLDEFILFYFFWGS
jgi:hypothetical protein